MHGIRDAETAREITYNNFEISLVVFMPNITTNNAITYTNTGRRQDFGWDGGIEEPYNLK